MFNLVDMLKKEEPIKIKEESLTSVLFFQTQACHSLVLEAFRFEGISAPAILENNDENIKNHIRDAHIEIVLVELNDSDNISKDMERISHLLPNSASVIVIGSEDAISTIRNLKAMGYYYLFWPISKQELIDFIRSVNNNRVTNSGLGQGRQAKKIAVWGSKGGVGASILTAEIAFQLSEKKKSKCIVVDHNFTGGNLDILMGLRQFEKKQIHKGSLSNSLDASFALSLTQKINDMLAILALHSDDLNEWELKDYIGILNNELVKHTNFIVEDFSGSANCKQDLDYVATNCDCMVLVLEPTVSSLREATKIKAHLDRAKSAARLIIVLNNTMQEKAASVSATEIAKNLRQAIDITCPFEEDINSLILQGKRIYQQKGKIGESLQHLTSLLIGESIEENKSSLIKRLVKRA